MDQTPFSPMFVFPTEYTQFGLPSATAEPDIDNLVQLASTMIDEHCGRTDGNGLGSLVYTTYVERLTSQSLARNIYYVPHRPLVTLTQSTINALSPLTTGGYNGVTGNYFYTGALPSINQLAVARADGGTLSAIIAASGRFAYGRRSAFRNDPWDISATINPVGALSLQAGPSQWFALDMANLDYSEKTGEVWFSDISLIGVNYNEVVITYNSGFDPRYMPKQIKLATAALTKNLMGMGGGTTGMTSFTSNRAGVSARFTPDAIDDNIKNLLRNFVTVRTY